MTARVDTSISRPGWGVVIFGLVILLLLLVVLFSDRHGRCDGPFEEAAEEIEDAADDVGDAVRDIGDR